MYNLDYSLYIVSSSFILLRFIFKFFYEQIYYSRRIKSTIDL
nr:MAG TPA: hypothetical protein [Caudoviricetes sp.]